MFKNTLETDYITGIDEAGRGPLAGPVVAAAVTLPACLKRAEFPFMQDSKKLSEKKRLQAFSWIIKHATSWSYFAVGPAHIDAVNIRRATLEAMRRSYLLLTKKGKQVLIDGKDIPESLNINNVQSLIGGDQIIEAISCASIVAKVIRDKMMFYYDTIYPDYQFARHKGYGTKAHYQAIHAFGLSPVHRKSFSIKEHLLS